MAWARSACKAAKRAAERYRLYMGLTLLGGALFLVVKAIEYSEKFSHDLYPSTNNFLGAVLHADRPARDPRHRRDGRQRVSVGPGTRMWHAPARALHEPDRGRRHLLALRGRGLDFPVPGVVSAMSA